ncbi:MAG: hypothetical protein N3A57_01545 [Negativicutes bacterium]|nr:hypothetical protein [Negativicutes bacterium]
MGLAIVWVIDFGCGQPEMRNWCRSPSAGIIDQTGGDLAKLVVSLTDALSAGFSAAIGLVGLQTVLPVVAGPELSGSSLPGRCRPAARRGPDGGQVAAWTDLLWLMAQLGRQADRGRGLIPTLHWQDFWAGTANLLVWQGAVGSRARKAAGLTSCETAAMAFWQLGRNERAADRRTGGQVFSWPGAALVWAGLSDDPDLLTVACETIRC